MIKLTFSAITWVRAETPPRSRRQGLGIPQHYQIPDVIHLHEKGRNRALCGYSPRSRWLALDAPDGEKATCQKCLHTALIRGWAVEEDAPAPTLVIYERPEAA